MEAPPFKHEDTKEYHLLEKDRGYMYYDGDTREIKYTFNLEYSVHTVLGKFVE